MKRILITGAAGFIGFHLAQKLCALGHEVLGLDNVNDYYDIALKLARLEQLNDVSNFTFEKVDIADRGAMEDVFTRFKPHIVLNMAAQAGVRYSITNPHAYVDSNVQGFLNILEGARHCDVEHLIFASSSSVYGLNTTLPFSTTHNVDHPISLYAATKKSNELMAHTYAHLYDLPTTGLRFFTVYGPWGRPDMAVYSFTRSILAGTPINVFNHGNMQRDFTYIDDIVEAVVRLVDTPAQPDAQWSGSAPNAASSSAPYCLYNIGNNNPERLMDLITTLEEALGVQAEKNMMDMQPGDVQATFADTHDLARDVGFSPSTSLKHGIEEFVKWYREYHV